MTLLLVSLAFLCGSLPLSLWLGRMALGVDIRRFGDGNPGATNVLRAGGRSWGLLAMLLDGLKGAIPVGVAHFALGSEGLALAAVAVAPPLGHAFSPFLRGQGGKAVAAVFGAWAGLTVWEGPTVLGLSLGLAFALIATPAWALALAMSGLLLYFALTPPAFNLPGFRPELWPTLAAVWLGHALILAWKHRGELGQRPALRSWLRRRLPT